MHTFKVLEIIRKCCRSQIVFAIGRRAPAGNYARVALIRVSDPLSQSPPRTLLLPLTFHRLSPASDQPLALVSNFFACDVLLEIIVFISRVKSANWQ
jgi:hypothetical protein